MTIGSDVGAHSARSEEQPDHVAAPTDAARRRWSAVLGTVLLVSIAVAVVGAAALVFVFHPRFDTVLSGSMRPGIQPGDVVVVRAVPTDKLKVGDVIAYLPPTHTTPVLHRIVSIDSTGLVTQGDANNVSDPWGKVSTDSATTLRLVWVIPKIGLIAHNRSTVLIGAGALLVAATALTVLTHQRGGKDHTDDADEADSGPSETDDSSPSEGGSGAVPNGVNVAGTWSRNAVQGGGVSSTKASTLTTTERELS